MAISQMQTVSFVLGNHELDTFLQLLQSTQLVEIKDMPKQTTWQAAFRQEQVHIPKIYQELADGPHQLLKGEQVFQELSRRQQHLESTMARLENYIPRKSKFTKLKQAPLSVSVAELDNPKRQEQAELAYTQINQKLDRLSELDKAMAVCQDQQEQLADWVKLKVLPKDLTQFKHLSALVGTIPNTSDDSYYRLLQGNPDLAFEEVFRNQLEYGVILFWDKGKTIPLDELQFKALDYPYPELPAKMLANSAYRLAEYEKERQQLTRELAAAELALQQMQLATDFLLSSYLRQAAKKQLASTKNLVALEGWVERAQLPLLKQVIAERFGTSIYISESEVDKADWDEVPIKLVNHPVIAPFELFTEMYALPKYYEQDPTPILAPFYFTFFGMMVADLGYGLLLFGVTWFALQVFKLPNKQRRFLRFFNSLSLAVALWGLVYGSFFGFTLPFVLISTRTDVMTILMLSVIFGFITVMVGLLLGGLQHVKMKDYAKAYSSGFAWCLILLGIFLLALGKLVPGLALLAELGKWLAIFNAVGVVLVAIVKARSLLGLGVGLYNLYNISGYIGDLVSFTRLMALGLSGASIASAFNLIVGILPPLARFTVGILLFALLHAINIFLSLLSGYVHGARLMFVEFFGKFYQGGGKPFQPLKISEKYITIHKENPMEEK
ncbi:V-type ATP synthase subunit I [Streptococcus halichoeri]|uniref:V-type ATP synthase subunit I n=1 Tax=Streptococcus halichoeri TaxID=254785 RepID=UPI00135C1D6F|nr:V-type ATP synthase subunit I [Streptococcus halichoeri]